MLSNKRVLSNLPNKLHHPALQSIKCYMRALNDAVAFCIMNENVYLGYKKRYFNVGHFNQIDIIITLPLSFFVSDNMSYQTALE